jgi:general secretion pathway protein D
MRAMPKLVFVAFLLGVQLFSAVPVARAQHTLNLRDADVRAFIQDAARVTGRTFIIDQRVQGKVSVVTDRPLSRSEYFELFLSVLRANGLVAVPAARSALRIQPADTAAAQPGRVGGSQSAARNQFLTEVFRLKSVEAASAVETLRPLVSKEGSLTANRSGNSIVIADYADNIRRMRDLLQRIDRDTVATKLLPLRNAGAREVATSLQTLMGGAEAKTSVVAIDSSNSIALRGDAAAVSRLTQIAKDLDERAGAGAEVRIHWLEHADAEKLVPVLQQLVGQAAAPATPEAGSSTLVSATGSGIARRGPAVVTRYEGANAVIVAANPDVQRTLGEVVRQLDTRREQVLVEAIIVEIGDNAAKRLGVQFLLAGKPGSNVPFAATNYSNAVPNILTIGGAIGAEQLNRTTTTVNGTTTTTSTSSALGNSLQEAAAGALLNATGGFAGLAARIGKDAVFGAIINAVKSDTESNILSTPSILTLDNQEASVLVGQDIPITTGEALSRNFDNAFRTVQRENVGIQLEVKPQINSSGAIKLFLRQEVSSVAGPVSNRNADLIINKREFKTTFIVDDGDILAIGGLLDDNERRTLERIPGLSNIPIIGNLFKSKSRTRSKTNLMVFIRPTILRNRDDALALTAQRYGYIRDRQLAQNPDSDAALDVLVRDYMGAAVPQGREAIPGDQIVQPGVAPLPGDTAP